MNDERLFDLLDLWEARLDHGIELSPEELAAGDALLADAIRPWIEPLKATRWMRSPLADPRLAGPSDTSHAAATQTPSGPPASPTVLGSYTILGTLGRGGMGDVYLGRHQLMDRLAAIKILPHAATRRPDALARFHREIRALAKLSHPHIVTAFDAGEDHGLHYLAMEYVPGLDLYSLVARLGPLPWPLAARLTAQAADGLAYAHSRGLIHRDVKPSNLMIAHDEWSNENGCSRGACGSRSEPQRAVNADDSTIPLDSCTLKILDLGLARALTDLAPPEESLTHTGAILGTIDFLAPEQSFAPESVDHRADIYSLGCTLYFLLTGRCLFSRPTLAQKLLAHRDDAPPLLTLPLGEGRGEGLNRGAGLRPAVPLTLLTLLNSILAKSPADRPPSMSAVSASIAEILSTAAPPHLTLRIPHSALLPSLSLSHSPSLPLPHSHPQTPRSALRFPSRRAILTAALAVPAASLAAFGSFTIWKRIAKGTLEIHIDQPGIQAARFYLNCQPSGHWSKSDGPIATLQLPSGSHDLRILADAHYPSIHQLAVPLRGLVRITAAFSPAFTWRFLLRSDEIFAIEAAEPAWQGWGLTTEGGHDNPTADYTSLVRHFEQEWRIIPSPDDGWHRIALCRDGHYLVCGALLPGETFRRTFVSTNHPSHPLLHWRPHSTSPNTFSLEYLPQPSSPGYYLAPQTASPHILLNPKTDKDLEQANHAGLRDTRP